MTLSLTLYLDTLYHNPHGLLVLGTLAVAILSTPLLRQRSSNPPPIVGHYHQFGPLS